MATAITKDTETGTSGAVTVKVGADTYNNSLGVEGCATTFTIAAVVTGSTPTGTLAITYTMCSHKAGTYFTPTGGGTIVSGLGTATGGLAFEPEMFPFSKIVLTATSQTCVATVHLNIQ